jgi:release factor glutamine methyltransferase
MNSQIKRVYFEDFVFLVDENVYEPSEDSFLFAENLKMERSERVLDMGTGCGIQGVIAARRANGVLAIDVNPYALRCAMENATLNTVRGKMAFVQGDLFTPLSESTKFDVILFNAPYLPVDEGEADSWLSRAWAGGSTGRKIIDRFILDAPKYLKPRGRVLLMQSTLVGVDETVRKFAECSLGARVVAERALPFFETITLLEATF